MEQENSVMTKSGESAYLAFLHLAALLLLFVPFLGGIIGVGSFWLFRRKSSKRVDQHGRRAMNWQISLLLLIIFCLGGAMLEGWMHHRNYVRDSGEASMRLNEAKTEAERVAAIAALNELGKHHEAVLSGKINAGFFGRMYGYLIALIALADIGFVCLSAYRAYQGREAIYPPSLRVFRVENAVV